MLDADTPSPDHGPLLRSPQQEREFAAALRLRDWVAELLAGPAKTEWTMAPGHLDNIFVSTCAKGIKTFRAALLLCDRGYGPQAGMLTRSLFEHAMVSWWMLLCVDDEDAAMEAIDAHHEHSRVVFARAAKEHPQAFGGKPIRTVDAETAARLDKRFTRYGTVPWHGKRLDELVREVETAADSADAGQFRLLFQFVNAQNNYTLHHTPLGLTDTVDWESVDQAPVVHAGPSSRGLRETLWAVTRVFGLIIDATLRRFSPNRVADFAAVFEDVLLDLSPLSEEQIKGVGRNDPCPCGSGAKFKRCHEPRVGYQGPRNS